MYLINTIQAEVEPVPGQNGWYQLTGREIKRWTIPACDTAIELRDAGIQLHTDAKILGVHNVDEEIADGDPRFNEENDPEWPSFYVYTDPKLRKTFMMLDVNQAEYAILRFLVPHESGAECDDAPELYRIEA